MGQRCEGRQAPCCAGGVASGVAGHDVGGVASGVAGGIVGRVVSGVASGVAGGVVSGIAGGVTGGVTRGVADDLSVVPCSMYKMKRGVLQVVQHCVQDVVGC
eukprot:223057-Chlamydomonas_euryale.AAC.1